MLKHVPPTRTVAGSSPSTLQLFFQLSKSKTGRRPPASSGSEDDDDEEDDEEEDEVEDDPSAVETPEPPKKKTKPPRKDDAMTKSIKRVLEKKFQQRKIAFGKHRNVDRATGVDHIVSFAGTTFKITEFKLRPQKPRPKNYPDKDKESPNAVNEKDDLKANDDETQEDDDVKQEIAPPTNTQEGVTEELNGHKVSLDIYYP